MAEGGYSHTITTEINQTGTLLDEKAQEGVFGVCKKNIRSRVICRLRRKKKPQPPSGPRI